MAVSRETGGAGHLAGGFVRCVKKCERDVRQTPLVVAENGIIPTLLIA